MIDWVVLFTGILCYIQWLDVFIFFGVIGMAFIGLCGQFCETIRMIFRGRDQHDEY